MQRVAISIPREATGSKREGGRMAMPILHREKGSFSTHFREGTWRILVELAVWDSKSVHPATE